MKKINCASFTKLICVFVLTGLAAISAAAAPKPPADLQVQILGPATANVYSPYTYTVRVDNTANGRADNVRISVTLPLTDTSPNKHIMGELSGIDNDCQRVGNKLECNVGSIRGRRDASVSFNLKMPLSTKTLTISASAVTDSNESNTNNNSGSITPTPAYGSINIGSANVLNSHCTGQGLTSYFECTLYTSSITTHNASLDLGGLISFAYPGYDGVWSQPSPSELNMTYREYGTPILEFHGYAVSATCFEGVATFPQNTQYVSPYSVCLQ